MRRTARLLSGTAFAVAVVGVGAVPAYGGSAGLPAAHLRGPSAGGLEVYPTSVVPGGQVTVNTADCGDGGTAAGDASAVGAGAFTLAPSTHEGDAIGQFQVPPSAQPGTYEIVATCAEGGRRVTGDLVVTLTSARAWVHPRGSVKTGVGGALGPDPVQTAAGVAALAVAAAGGTWLLHRRARGDGI
ncbi:hypothetical protein [Streptomyces resistomycificus]|uniref:Sortase n=1 Tax=Streptomyces resistomycificus TaxID=67356 RepID=A0A0L8LRX7_9ACTN|nr:hypothetical protein [Streptomyces resistomycificus]KOG40860.1 hypothetical protein ADK37_07965 [Streptomyces resistomycificus]KUN99176.1 hypothetical protein AQJ84_12105 [Streptomyces resistomycificus]